MLNVHFTVLAILELALIHSLFEPAQLAFPLFTAPPSIFLRRFAPRLSKRKSIIEIRNDDDLFKNLTQIDQRAATQPTSTRLQNPFYEFYKLPQNDFIHNILPVLQSPAIEILNHYHLNHLNHRLNNDLTSRLDNRLDRLDTSSSQLDEHYLNSQQKKFNDQHHELISSNHQIPSSSSHSHHQPIFIHHSPTIQHYSFYHLQPHPHLIQRKQLAPSHYRYSNNHLPIVNQTPFSLLSKVQQLKQKFRHQKSKFKHQSSKFDYHLNKLKSLNSQLSKSKLSHHNHPIVQLNNRNKLDQLTAATISPLSENSLTTISTLTRTGYLEIGSTAHLNQFDFDTEGEDYLDSNNVLDQNGGNSNLAEVDSLLNNQGNQAKVSRSNGNELNDLEFKNTNNNKSFNDSSLIIDSSTSSSSPSLSNNNHNLTGNVISNLFTSPTVTKLIKSDIEHLLNQIKPNFVNFNHHPKNLDHQSEQSKYAYDLIGSNSTTGNNFNQDINQNNENVQVDFKERTAPDISAGLFSRALGSLTNYIPSAMKITRTTGCVGGTRCEFFLSCWMISSGSLGSSCGPLSTCCITPSKQDIQPAFYGPVVNDPNCGRSATRISRIVGGTDASFGQFPWQAFVQVGGSRCGGALVGQKHVVTAGHCVARSQHNPSEIRVTLGDYILNSDIESLPHEVFTVAEVKLHPNFRFTPQADRYDIAILVLDRVVHYRNNIKPICLPQKDANFLGRVAYVAGWGALQAGSKLRPKVLQHVNVPVIDNNVCEIWHRKRGINIRIHDEMICAGYQAGNKDACQGDSGGPLMLNEFGVWYLIGIVSAGYSCAKMYQPGIYHRVSSSSDWVSASIYQNAN